MALPVPDTRTIYDLNLHETITLNLSLVKVMRVPSGWLYTTRVEGSQTPVQTFVPYCEKEASKERRGRA